MDSYYKKYLKYKNKYLTKKNQNGGNFKCMHTNMYDDICVSNVDGEYKTKEDCMETCINSFIDNLLVHAEFLRWNLFLSSRINAGNDVYVKGGTVLGLKVAQLLFNKTSDAEKFNELLDLNLIKDWDFTIIGKNLDDVDEETNEMKNEGKTMKKYRYKGTTPRLALGDDALFEISIKDDEKLSDLEIPMTSMKIKVTLQNIKYIFVLALYFYLIKQTDEHIKLFGNVKTLMNRQMVMDIIKRIEVIVPDCMNGMFNIDEKKDLDTGGLNTEMIDVIKNTTDNKNEQQMIISHIKEPDRMIVRLFPKNIKKSEKISNFLEQLNIDKQPWLLDRKNIEILIEDFLNNLDGYIQNKYNMCIQANYDIILKKNLLHMHSKSDTKTVVDLISKITKIQDFKYTDKIGNKFIKNIQEEKKQDVDFYNNLGIFYSNVNIGRLSSLITKMNNKDVNRIIKLMPHIPYHLFNSFKSTDKQVNNIRNMIRDLNTRNTKSKNLIDRLQSTKVWDDLCDTHDNILMGDIATQIVGIIPSVSRFKNLADDVEKLILGANHMIMPIYTTELCQVELGFWQKALAEKKINCFHVGHTCLSFITSKELDITFNDKYVNDDSWCVIHIPSRLREQGEEEPDRFTCALMIGPIKDAPENILFIGIHLEAGSAQNKHPTYFLDIVIPAIERAKEKALQINKRPLSHIIIIGDINNVCRKVLHTQYKNITDPVLRFDIDYDYQNKDHQKIISTINRTTMERYPVSGHGNPEINDGYNIKNTDDLKNICGQDVKDGRGTIDAILCIPNNPISPKVQISDLQLVRKSDWDWVASQTFDKEPSMILTSHNSDHVAVYAKIRIDNFNILCVSAAQLGIQKLQNSLRTIKNKKIVKNLFDIISAERINSNMQTFINGYITNVEELQKCNDMIAEYNTEPIDIKHMDDNNIKNIGICIGYIKIRDSHMGIEKDPFATLLATHQRILSETTQKAIQGQIQGESKRKPKDNIIQKLETMFTQINPYWKAMSTQDIYNANIMITKYKKKDTIITDIENIKKKIKEYTRSIYKYKELVDILFKKEILITTATTLLCDKLDKKYITNWTGKSNDFHANLVGVLSTFLKNANNYFLIPPQIIALSKIEEIDKNHIFKLNVANYLDVQSDPNPKNKPGYAKLLECLHIQSDKPVYGVEIDLKNASSYIMSLFIKTYTFEEIKSIGGYPLAEFELPKKVVDGMYTDNREINFKNILNVRIWNLIKASKININNLESNYKLLDMSYLQHIVLADEFVKAINVSELNKLLDNMQYLWYLNGDSVIFYFSEAVHRNSINNFFGQFMKSSILGIKIINYS